MTTMVVYTVLVVGLIANLCFAWKFCRALVRSARASGVVAKAGKNDDTGALDSVLWLIEEARDSLEIFNDGNRMTESIYVQQRLVDALSEKLDTHPDFRVTCFFNDRARDLPFRRAFADHPQVEIFAGLDPERQSREKEVHYKIVDGGRIGYVTQHGYSESERKYQQWDCRHLPEKQMKAKAAFLYKKMRERALTKRARLNPQAA